MFGDLRADVFSAKKNPFLKHNNSSNRSKTKTAIIANSWNYHICEAPRTTASFPSGSKKNSVTQCWRIWSFPTMLRFFKEFTELTGRRLRQWHQVGPLCRLLHSLPPVRHYYSLRLIARHWFFPRYDARLLALAGGRAVPIFCCMCTHILLMTINISL